MEALVAKVFPLIQNEKTLSLTSIAKVVSSLQGSVTAEQKGLALSALQATIAKWQTTTTGTVPAELEASFETLLELAFAPNKEAAEVVVEKAVSKCCISWSAIFCRSVAKEIQVVGTDISEAVAASSLSEPVKAALESVVGVATTDGVALATAAGVKGVDVASLKPLVDAVTDAAYAAAQPVLNVAVNVAATATAAVAAVTVPVTPSA